ncbi:MAG: type II methionyl aminopeptidase [Candidatus Methanospirareceae archaeon]
MKGLIEMEKEEIEDVLEKYRKAGRVVKEVKEEVVEKIKEGESILKVAEFVEKRIREKGAEPAFPCNISLNEEAAHATPSIEDEAVFGKDVVKIDIGAHIDGYIGDSAITVDLSGEEENLKMIKASEEALRNAIGIIREGVSTIEIGEVIEKTVRKYGFKPIVNLTGHGLAKYNQHAPPSIPNVRYRTGVVLKENDVIALEPFVTNGAGRVVESKRVEIYKMVREKPVRIPEARKLMEEVKKYKGLPFAKRWLPRERLDIALRTLSNAGVLREYPVLREALRGIIAQAEHTIIVKKDGCEVIT